MENENRLNKFQYGLAVMLRKQGVEKELASVILNHLYENDDAVCRMLVWLWHERPTRQDVIHYMATHPDFR